MTTPNPSTASQTLSLLESRLKRIEYYIFGDTVHPPPLELSSGAISRIAHLERSLQRLSSQSRVIHDLLRLHARHPTLFHPSSSDEIPTTLDSETLLSIILASASAYSSIASRLTSVIDAPVPDTKLSCQLATLAPRIEKVEEVQMRQSREVAELKSRSAEVIREWYKRRVVDGGSDWVGVEERLGKVERAVRRTESVRHTS